MSIRLFFFIFAFFFSLVVEAKSIRIVSYNCENLFDTVHCEGKSDMEFTPLGDKEWSSKKFQRKTRNIASVLTAIGEWEKPAVIGLIEIENDFVLRYLTERTQLASQNYKFVHRESHDERGIDVALLYDSAEFHLVKTEFLNVDVPEKSTREILFATGILSNGDTLHVFVNHWPSRYGGELVSEHRRFKAARVLREKVDSIYDLNPNSNVVIMGDLNDYPNNASVKDTLGAVAFDGKIEPKALYNLMYKYNGSGSIGTHYFAGEWGVLDQMIVSPSMLDSRSCTYCKPEDVMIFYEDFILEKNAKGVKVPKRSFKGNFFSYKGYSDHLPIYLDVQLNSK
ncbi:MAG: endonuclease [Paludibacteraceae bacterium]|nr:endonuclease [Paludibacteraceae bacterium]